MGRVPLSYAWVRPNVAPDKVHQFSHFDEVFHRTPPNRLSCTPERKRHTDAPRCCVTDRAFQSKLRTTSLATWLRRCTYGQTYPLSNFGLPGIAAVPRKPVCFHILNCLSVLFALVKCCGKPCLKAFHISAPREPPGRGTPQRANKEKVSLRKWTCKHRVSSLCLWVLNLAHRQVLKQARGQK